MDLSSPASGHYERFERFGPSGHYERFQRFGHSGVHYLPLYPCTNYDYEKSISSIQSIEELRQRP